MPEAEISPMTWRRGKAPSIFHHHAKPIEVPLIEPATQVVGADTRVCIAVGAQLHSAELLYDLRAVGPLARLLKDFKCTGFDLRIEHFWSLCWQAVQNI